MEKNTFRITGMHCTACQKVSKLKLGTIEGVGEVTVLQDGAATIMASRKLSLTEVQAALQGTEYKIVYLNH
ncbi:MAG: heavy metal-associated domain-containing protein [Candidatus Moranbacteria bacterium]|nr:heavy metal-associated domain-containing protein [Candidatus Moranbacteria bacterium]